jgi:hypothetical protein
MQFFGVAETETPTIYGADISTLGWDIERAFR